MKINSKDFAEYLKTSGLAEELWMTDNELEPFDDPVCYEYFDKNPWIAERVPGIKDILDPAKEDVDALNQAFYLLCEEAPDIAERIYKDEVEDWFVNALVNTKYEFLHREIALNAYLEHLIKEALPAENAQTVLDACEFSSGRLEKLLSDKGFMEYAKNERDMDVLWDRTEETLNPQHQGLGL